MTHSTPRTTDWKYNYYPYPPPKGVWKRTPLWMFWKKPWRRECQYFDRASRVTPIPTKNRYFEYADHEDLLLF